MGTFYTSQTKATGDPASWFYGTTSSYKSSLGSFAGSTKVSLTTPGTDTTSQLSDTASYEQNRLNVGTFDTNISNTVSKLAGTTSSTNGLENTRSAGGAGLTYYILDTRSSTSYFESSLEHTATKRTFSSQANPLIETFTFKGTSTQTNGSSTSFVSTLTFTNSTYRTYETTIKNETTKWKTELTNATSAFSTGASDTTYESFLAVCSSTTKTTNSTDTISTMLATVNDPLTLTGYSDKASTSEIYSARSASTITGGQACQTNCLGAYEFYLDTHDALVVSTHANGAPLQEKQVWTTSISNGGSAKITQTMGAGVLSVKKGYIAASITDESDKTIEATTGATSQLIYTAYTLDTNSSIVPTNITYEYGQSGTQVNLSYAPIYTITNTSAILTKTSFVGVLPYYFTYTQDDTTLGRLVGHLSLTQETTISLSAVTTTQSYTSDYYGSSGKEAYNTTTTYTSPEGTFSAFITSYGKVFTSTRRDTGSYTYESFSQSDGRKNSYAELRTAYTSESFSQESVEGETRFYRLDAIKESKAYPSPFNQLRLFTPAMAPGTVAFGGLDEVDDYTSKTPHLSLSFATSGETFSTYDDSLFTAQLINRPISAGVSMIPTGKCFQIPSTTSATYKWMTSSDWPQSGTSSKMSAKFASTSTYTTSAGAVGSTSRITQTSTDYKSMTMSLSLTDAILPASATDNFVVVGEAGFGELNTILTTDKLNSIYDVGVGVNHADKMARSRQIYYPAGHYSITQYPDKQGTSNQLEYTTQSTAAWMESVEDNIRLRISAEPLYYIATKTTFAGNALIGAGVQTIKSEFNYNTDDPFI